MANTSQKRSTGRVAVGGSGVRPNSAEGPLRARELAWLMEHPEELAKYEGEWVVLEADRIVCHGSYFVSVVDQARTAGITSPFAVRIPAKGEGPVVV